MDTTELLISDFKLGGSPADLNLPTGTTKEARKIIWDLLLRLHLASAKSTRLEDKTAGLEKENAELMQALKNVSGTSRPAFWSALGGLALLLLTCFIITWATRPSMEEIREATRHQTVKEVLRETAPNGVISLEEAGRRLGFEVIKTPQGEIYISFPKE
jgi:predicted transcriptional regulator